MKIHWMLLCPLLAVFLLLSSDVHAQPNRPVDLRIQPMQITSGDTATGTVTLRQNAPAGGALVTIVANTNFPQFPPHVLVPEGQRSATFTITTSPACSQRQTLFEAVYEGQPSRPKTRLRTLPSSDACIDLAGLSLSSSSIAPGETVTGTVTMSGPALDGGSLVSLSSTLAVFDLPETVLIPEGEASATFEITVPDQCLASNSGQVIARLASTGTQRTANLSLQGGSCADLLDVVLAPDSVMGGQTAEFILSIDPPAAAEGFIVDLESSTSNAILPTSFVTFQEGEWEKSVTVTTREVCDNVFAIIAATARSTGTIRSATLDIEADSSLCADLLSLELLPAIITAGDSTVGRLTLSQNAPEGGLAVELESINSLVIVPPTVIVPGGESSVDFIVETARSCAPTSGLILAYLPETETELRARLLLDGNACPELQVFDISPQVLVGGTRTFGYLAIDDLAGPGGHRLTLETSHPHLVDLPSEIVIAEEEDFIQFPIDTFEDCEVDQFIVITARQGFPRVSLSLQIFLRGPACYRLVGLELAESTLVSGTETSGTVTLSQPAPAGGISIGLESSLPEVAVVPGSILVPEGDAQATFAIPTEAICAPRDVTLRAIDARSGEEGEAILSLGAADIPCADLHEVIPSRHRVTGGESFNLTLRLGSPAVNGPVTLTIEADAPVNLPSTVVIEEGHRQSFHNVTTGTVEEVTQATVRVLNEATGTERSFTMEVVPEGGGGPDDPTAPSGWLLQ